MKKVIVAGATGYLGKYLLKELKSKGFETLAMVRNAKKLEGIAADGIIQAEVTQPESLNGVFNNIDVVISTVGITRQKDDLSYMDVDYQANKNLLNEAVRAGVKKFIYVSVLNGQKLRHLKMVAAKEQFADELKESGIDYTIIRPNGFFSDMEEVLQMAKKGTVYLFGNGKFKSNPIHGADLASFIVSKINGDEKELEVGGPDVLTQNQIAQAAFNAIDKKPNIMHIALWIRDIALRMVRFFTNQLTYGPIEFFMTVMTMDMVAPAVGQHHLGQYYASLIEPEMEAQKV